jgi:hypothetical protein
MSITAVHNRHQGRDGDANRLAHVVEAKDGSAARIADLETGATATVIGHMSAVPRLSEGDTVGVTHYPQGPVVTGRLRGQGEAPAGTVSEINGQLMLSAEQAITLHVGQSQLRLTADGAVSLDGQRIHQIGHERISLDSTTIEIN